MNPISPQEFLVQPLRAHSLLAGVPLHDVWAIDLAPLREGITLREFFRLTKRAKPFESISWPARALFGLRILLGRIFGWDKEPEEAKQISFVERLSEEDRNRSTVLPGTAEGFFRVVYSFENEVLREAANRIVHAATLFALFRNERGYRLYFAVYVQRTNWITPVYMALIGPFRKWIVYPAIFQQMQRNWARVFGRDEGSSAGIKGR